MAAARWNQAITDFKLAIKYKYNLEQQFKIHHKIGQCFIKKKSYKKAVSSFTTALELVNKQALNLNENTRKEFNKILVDCINKFSAKADDVKKTVEDFKPLNPSNIDPRVTDQVEVLETVGKGRNAFAKNNIPVGSILAVVDAIGPHLNPDNAAQREFLEPSSSGDWPVPVNNDVEKFSLLFQMAMNEKEVSEETHARHSLVVVLLLRALRKTTYYKDGGLETPAEKFSQQELLLGKLMYKLRLIQDMNSHPIWGVSRSQKDKIGKDHIGAGLYTGIGSYFNSDCNPNTFRVNIGKKMLLIASKNIKRGQEVMDNYCIHFSELPTVTRRPWIQEHFLFYCECEACEEDWPTYSNLPQDRPNQKIADKLVALEMENIECIEKGNIDKAVESHKKEITLIQGGLSEPHQLPVTIRNSFQFCWWKKVVQYLQQLEQADPVNV
ncbi:uncharacterized protein LOC111699383 [Eurytemora carolleeae]|uniref:uncharacterized protein LOC111699383 n=1 Tax=Eurytemora carolleeae TaxID=1294199 RepID=UPI000C75C823|nr:uncharacterized protein LOC111699383 [Eurytemora carolleeae]|eukprot:XP_023325824.1 uncharacterized protein LOC111699383 [Eurytemora affinis]